MLANINLKKAYFAKATKHGIEITVEIENGSNFSTLMYIRSIVHPIKALRISFSLSELSS